MYLMIIESDIVESISRHKSITSSRYDVTGSLRDCLRCFSSATFLWIALVDKYLLRNAVSNSDHLLKSDSLSSNQAPADCVNLPRTISMAVRSFDSSFALVMFFTLFKKRSTSSEGCPENFGKSSNRALRAFSNNVRSVIVVAFGFNNAFEVGVESIVLRDEEFVMIVYGINVMLFFLT